MTVRCEVAGERVVALRDGWRLAVTPAGACAGPTEAAQLTDWIEAPVPGTAAQALEAAGRWRREAPTPLHDKDVWYRLALPEDGRRTLAFDGLATLAEAWIDERPLLSATSMFQPHAVDADLPLGATLWLCFRALTPRLAAKGPRARWRPAMIDDQGLRLVRTTLLGHMPGWCPPIDIVGPWRPVRLIARGETHVEAVRLRPSWMGGEARLSVAIQAAGLTGGKVRCAGASAALAADGTGWLTAEFAVPGAQPWRPHTHGDQPLYPVSADLGGVEARLGRVGFRAVELDRGADGAGFALRINGEPVFCRGACWPAPPDLVTVGGTRADYEPRLRLAREAGFNMIRLSGVGAYESPDFFALCDELGLLVWQDFMFANFDYPAADPAFVAQVQAEATALLRNLQGSPSLAVLCGGSEVMQQAAMMGLPTEGLAWPLYDETLADVAAAEAPGVPYVRNTPSGGALPFVADQGVTHYYGVGAYERPLEDARRANVRFAAESLAFANLPQPESLKRTLAVPAVHDPRWKAGVPRDRGASWDFEDTRDHYLGRLFGVDPARLRREDPALYLDLSRAVSGEVMAAVFAEWRRTASPCGGGLVWTLHDLAPGAGWGLIDSLGEPKPAWHALRRVLQPVQVLLTDEGVNGLAVHLVNETAAPVTAALRLAVFGEEPGAVIDVRQPVELAPRSAEERSAYGLIGRFFDLTYAYRFGPRAHAATLAQLIADDGAVLSQAMQFAPGVGAWDSGGEVAAALDGAGDRWRLTLTAQRLQRYVHIADAGFRPLDDGAPLTPGEPRVIELVRREGSAAERPEGEILAPGGHVLGRY